MTDRRHEIAAALKYPKIMSCLMTMKDQCRVGIYDDVCLFLSLNTGRFVLNDVLENGKPGSRLYVTLMKQNEDGSSSIFAFFGKGDFCSDWRDGADVAHYPIRTTIVQ